MNSLSFKTRFGWISTFEEKGKIVKIKFGKHRNKNISKNLRKLKIKINSFFNKKNKTIKSNFLIEGNTIQKKVWRELTKIKIGKTKSYGEVAKKFKISPIIIGATVIAIGTSLPELLVSLYSILFLNNQEAIGIVVGNVLGSNIANVSLVLGFCAIMYKILFESNILKDLLFIFSLGLYVVGCILYNISINYIHGICLLLLFLGYFKYLIKNNANSVVEDKELSIQIIRVALMIILSIIGLSIGTNLIVENAINISDMLGINELIVGTTIVALGTS